MMSTRVLLSEQRIFLLKFFAVLMMLMAGADLALSLSEYLINASPEAFYYTKLTHVLASKPHYVAWYYSFAMFIALYHLLTSNKWGVLWIFGFIL